MPPLFRIFFLPPLMIQFLIPNSISFRTIFYLSSYPLWYGLQMWIVDSINSLQATRLGADLPPRVQGRWPLNLDVVISWSKNKEEDVVRTLFVMEKKYGTTYNTRALGEDQIMTTDPAVVKHVLVDNFDNFVKGPKFRGRAKGFLGDGIFNSDGDRWKFHRNLTRPFFHPVHTSPKLFVPIIKRSLDTLPQIQIPDEATTAFDAQAVYHDLALNQAVMWLCGVDLSIKETKRSDAWIEARDNLQNAIAIASGVVARRLKVGAVWPLFELTDDPLKKPMKTIRAFMDVLIDEAIIRRKERDVSTDGSNLHLIDRLVEATDDRVLIRDQLINILMAAKDTSVSMMTSFTYIIALMPEIATRLKAEIEEVVGWDGDIDKVAIRDMKICRAFINETLRLFPPIPLNVRRAVRPCILPTSINHQNEMKPLFMPAGATIVLVPMVLQRSKLIWGEDAEEFKLDRWLDGLTNQQREAYVSFSAGPRMCAGQPMALTVAHTFLVLLFQHLHHSKSKLILSPQSQPNDSVIPHQWLENPDGRLRSGRDKAWFVSDVTLYIKGGLWVKMESET